MANSSDQYPNHWLILGGWVFGLYFSAGLVYFETFRFPESKKILFSLPVFIILGLLSSLLVVLLFGKWRGSGSRMKVSTRMVLLPAFALVLAGMLIYTYSGFVAPEGFSSILLGRIYGNLLLVGLLPMVLILVVLQGRTTLPDLGGEEKIPITDEAGLPVKESGSSVPSIKIDPETQIFLENLVMVEAANNYCKFHWIENGQMKTKLNRMTMKEIHDMVLEVKFIFRCHRSFLVNAKMLEEISGNSQAYKLHLQNYDKSIPVSRSFDLEPLKMYLPK